MHPWRLADITYGQVKSGPPYEVAVLPLGATEPHNLHLPYGTDSFQVETIASRACALAGEQRGRGCCCCRPFRTARKPTRWDFPWP